MKCIITTCIYAFVLPLCLSFDKEPINILPLCRNYRHALSNAVFTNLTIRENRTSQIIYGHPVFPFTLKVNRNQTLWCAANITEIRRLPWDFPMLQSYKTQLRNFQGVLENGTDLPHQISYFTEAGIFYDNWTNAYYETRGDYCVESYSEEDIILRICPLGKVYEEPNTPWVIPKCCAVEEVLQYWEMSCVRLPETKGVTPWHPLLYSHEQDEPPQRLADRQGSFRFKMAEMPKNCSGTPETFRWWNGATVQNPEDLEERQQDNVHLVVPSSGDQSFAVVQLLLLNSAKRRWAGYHPEAFCVDGFYVNNTSNPKMKYTGAPENFVIYYCSDPSYDPGAESITAFSLYMSFFVFTFLILFVALMVYISLWKKHNLQGLIIFNFLLATFLSNIFRIISLALFLQKGVTSFYNDQYHRNWFCYAVGVLQHMLYFSSNMWMTIMNLDLWLTLSSMRAVREEGKCWKKFFLYSAVGWGLPVLLITAFIVLDMVYSDPRSLVPVPDYARATCIVSTYFKLEYVHIPTGIIMLINLCFIGMTIRILVLARRKATETFTADAVHTNRYSPSLFIKLFFFMGGFGQQGSVVSFAYWFFYTNKPQPWPMGILGSIGYCTPILLFILFCLNNRIVGQLRESYPKFAEPIWQFMQKIRGSREKRDCLVPLINH